MQPPAERCVRPFRLWGVWSMTRKKRLAVLLVLVVGTLFGTAVVATAPASADTVVAGCTIVTHPTPTVHTDCPGAYLVGANLAGFNLSYANLSHATLTACMITPPPNFSLSCTSTNLTQARLNKASLASATISACITFQSTPTLTAVQCGGPSLTGADLRKANLSNTDLSSADLSSSRLTGADISGALLVTCHQISILGYAKCPGANLSQAVMHRANLAGFSLGPANFAGADLTGSDLAGANFGLVEPPPVGTSSTDLESANLSHVNLTATNIGLADLAGALLSGATLTGTSLVPASQTVPATSSRRAVVTWTTPPSQPGATPGPCNRLSGSSFPIGTTTVRCSVLDGSGHQARGLFTVTVT